MLIEIKSEEHAKEISKLSYLEKLSQLKHVYEIEAHVSKLTAEEKEFYGVSVYDSFFSLRSKIKKLKKQLGMYVDDDKVSTYYNYGFGTGVNLYTVDLYLSFSFRNGFFSAFKSKNRKRKTCFDFNTKIASLSPNVYFQGLLLAKKYNRKLNKRIGVPKYFTAPNQSEQLKEKFICNFKNKKELATVISHLTGKNYVKVYKTIKEQGKFFTYNDKSIQTFNYFKSVGGGYTLMKGNPKFQAKKHLFLFETKKEVEDFKSIIIDDVVFVDMDKPSLCSNIASEAINILTPVMFFYIKEKSKNIPNELENPTLLLVKNLSDNFIIVNNKNFSLVKNNVGFSLGSDKNALKHLKIIFLNR